jgi:CRISPR-associated protein Cmr2
MNNQTETESNYIALTIGPIYTTIMQAKKTRAVWAGSYFFSWFMKEVLIASKEKGFSILLPYSKDISQTQNGTGKYADRIYFEKGNKSKGDLQEIIDTIITNLAEDIDKLCGADSVDAVTIFLKQYLNLHIIEASILNKAEVLASLNQLLDQRELIQYYPSIVERNYLQEYLGLEVSKGSLLAKDGFGEVKGFGFRSVTETATTSLNRWQPEAYKRVVKAGYKNEDLEMIDELVKTAAFKDLLRPHHKYMAVLYADGDNISNLLKAISTDSKALQEFSRRLLLFADKAEAVLNNYGGDSIFLGGEDLLAFLPMACITNDKKEQRNILSIINELDIAFKETIGDYAVEKGIKHPPTLSYGISINYVKHPLKESMHIAHKLMEQCKQTDNFPLKNAIGLRLQKHSGQYMECFIEKGNAASWKMIHELTAEYTKTSLSEKTEEVLSGVIHRFKDNLFFTAFAEAAKNKRLEAFFKNYFDEDVHSKEDKAKFLKQVRLLSTSLFEEYSNREDACRKILFTVFRIIHFINSKKD